MEECRIKKLMMDQTAKTQLAEFQLQAEETFKMQCLQVDQEAQTLVRRELLEVSGALLKIQQRIRRESALNWRSVMGQ